MPIIDYTHRPAPWRGVRRYWIEGRKLCWNQGGVRGEVPLEDIRQLRLHRSPSHGRDMVRCTLRTARGEEHRLLNHHWQYRCPTGGGFSPGYRDQSEAFDTFLAHLLQRLARHAGRVTYLEGPGRVEWIASTAMFAVAVLLLVGGLALTVLSEQSPLAPLAIMAVIALYLPVLWPIVRSGGPRPLDPASLLREREESL